MPRHRANAPIFLLSFSLMLLTLENCLHRMGTSSPWRMPPHPPWQPTAHLWLTEGSRGWHHDEPNAADALCSRTPLRGQAGPLRAWTDRQPPAATTSPMHLLLVLSFLNQPFSNRHEKPISLSASWKPTAWVPGASWPWQITTSRVAENIWNLCSHSPGGQRSETEVEAGLGFWRLRGRNQLLVLSAM